MNRLIVTLLVLLSCASQLQAADFNGVIDSAGPPPNFDIVVDGKRYGLADSVLIKTGGVQPVQKMQLTTGMSIIYRLSNEPGEVGKINRITVLRAPNVAMELLQH